MAATLAVQVDEFIRTELQNLKYNSVFWTDSLSVLMMISNANKHFPVFVANRLAKIEQASVPAQWRFIDSPSNVADHVSRGLTASELITNGSWFEGLSFLKHSQESLPKCPRVSPNFPEEFLVFRSHKTAI